MAINLTGLSVISPDNSSNGGQMSTKIEQPSIPVTNLVQEVDRGNGVISLNLAKGLSLDLNKTAPTMKNVKIGLGWDVGTDRQIDLDVFALLLHNGSIKDNSDIVFFNQLDTGKGVYLSGDNRTGEGEGDDESIFVELDKVPVDITSIAIFVNIYESKDLNFGMINNAYARIVDSDTDKEVGIHLLNEDSALDNAVHFVNLVRHENGWSFDTIGQGTTGNVNEIANRYLK